MDEVVLKKNISINSNQGGKSEINPMDINPNDAEFEKDNWTCAAGHYDNGKIVCIVPKLESYDPENMVYNVDIALNG